MNPPSHHLPEGAEILDASGRGGTGNMTLLFRRPQPGRVLKIYRTRRSRVREYLHNFSDHCFEGKRGARPAQRWAVERATLTAWAEEGFDVPQLIDRPLPPGIAPPALWQEWIDGRLLAECLRDPQIPVATKRQWITAYAAMAGRRHQRAIETRQTLLIHEHPGPQHVFVAGERLVTFDFENAYAATFPVKEAVAQEIADFLYSLERISGGDAAAFMESYIRGYPQTPRLSDLVRQFAHGRNWRRRIKRWADQRRRHGMGKTATMQKVMACLNGL